MAVSAAVRSSAPDKLLDTVLDELLEAVDDAVLGWIYLAQDPPDNLIWPAIPVSREQTVYLAAARTVAQTGPEVADLTCKRPGTGVSPLHWDDVLGRTVARALQTDDILHWEDLALAS